MGWSRGLLLTGGHSEVWELELELDGLCMDTPGRAAVRRRADGMCWKLLIKFCPIYYLSVRPSVCGELLEEPWALQEDKSLPRVGLWGQSCRS